MRHCFGVVRLFAGGWLNFAQIEVFQFLNAAVEVGAHDFAVTSQLVARQHVGWVVHLERILIYGSAIQCDCLVLLQLGDVSIAQFFRSSNAVCIEDCLDYVWHQLFVKRREKVFRSV